MVQTPTKSLSLEKFLHQPETKPASEFIDEIIQQQASILPEQENPVLNFG